MCWPSFTLLIYLFFFFFRFRLFGKIIFIFCWNGQALWSFSCVRIAGAIPRSTWPESPWPCGWIFAPSFVCFFVFFSYFMYSRDCTKVSLLCCCCCCCCCLFLFFFLYNFNFLTKTQSTSEEGKSSLFLFCFIVVHWALKGTKKVVVNRHNNGKIKGGMHRT